MDKIQPGYYFVYPVLSDTRKSVNPGDESSPAKPTTSCGCLQRTDEIIVLKEVSGSGKYVRAELRNKIEEFVVSHVVYPSLAKLTKLMAENPHLTEDLLRHMNDEFIIPAEMLHDDINQLPPVNQVKEEEHEYVQFDLG